jgi:hypothetical protein
MLKHAELIGMALIALWFGLYTYAQKPDTTRGQPPLTCYSEHDVYKVYDYTIADDNTTLITSHGRIYHIEACR